MVETIYDLKNNKKKQAPSLQAVALRKSLGSMVSKQSNFGGQEALNVSLQDILSVNVKGKWWLVGSAWKGSENSAPKTCGNTVKNTDLLNLAKAQKMNTDIRKSIFVTVMSSEDCIDCYNRIIKLGLKKTQERDIIRVLVHCAQQEQSYNPYYSLVISKFCENISFKVTLQYCIWDTLQNFSCEGKRGMIMINNLANLFYDLTKLDSTLITILKGLVFPLSNSNCLFLGKLFQLLMKNNTQQQFLKLFKNLKQVDKTGCCDNILIFLKSQKFAKFCGDLDYKPFVKVAKTIL
jgi:nucleolar MIF4G domain-containing protein 1